MATPKTTLWERISARLRSTGCSTGISPCGSRSLPSTSWIAVSHTSMGSLDPASTPNSSESSPVIALRHAVREDVVKFGTTCRLVLIEEDRERVEHLGSVIDRSFPVSERPRFVEVTCTHGKCEVDLLRCADQVGAWQGPIFANLDGWGVDTPFEIIARLGKQRSSEVLVTFQDQWFTRFATLAEQTAGDLVFGSAAWREVAELPTAEKKRFLVTEYRSVLASVGFVHTLTFEMVRMRAVTPCSLCSALAVSTVSEKMKDALWAVDPVGGARFRDPRDPDQLTFDMNTPDFHPLRRTVIDELARAGRQSLEALGRLVLEETMYKKSHVKPVVDELIQDTIVEQVANGRSYSEKFYRLRNGGSRAEQQAPSSPESSGLTLQSDVTQRQLSERASAVGRSLPQAQDRQWARSPSPSVSAVGWAGKRTDNAHGDFGCLRHVAVPAIGGRGGVRAELDDVSEMSEWVDGPAAAARVTGPDEATPAPGCCRSGQMVATHTLEPGSGSSGLSSSDPWATRRT